MPEGAIYVGRPSVFGNPFTIDGAFDAGFLRSWDPEKEQRQFVTDVFRQWLQGGEQWWTGPDADVARKAIADRLHELRGKTLVCWCPEDQACHADVLIELANAPTGQNKEEV